MRDFDKALGLARRIPLKPTSLRTQMRLIYESPRRMEVVERFGKEDIGSWPEKDAGPAFYYLGDTYARMRKGKEAVENLNKALENRSAGYMRGQAALTLAQTYSNVLRDRDKALEAFLQAQKVEKGRDRWGWVYLSSVTSAAAILRDQKKCDEALKMLSRVDVGKMGNSYWKSAMLVAYGRVYAARGDRAKALAKFKDALAVMGASKWQKARIKRKIKALEDKPQ